MIKIECGTIIPSFAIHIAHYISHGSSVEFVLWLCSKFSRDKKYSKRQSKLKGKMPMEIMDIPQTQSEPFISGNACHE